MAWPAGQEYADALQHPRSSFRDTTLAAGVPRLNRLGLPWPISGQFATVFEVRCSGRVFAVRCPLREIPGQPTRYSEVSKTVRSAATAPWVVPFDYLVDGILVRGQWYPIVKMEWIRGKPLHQWIGANLRNAAALRACASQFYDTYWLMHNMGIAHGDLQHGNVLVTTSGVIKLVDYDAMYVPALAGQPSGEIGHRNYQHPDRMPDLYGSDLDNFAAWVIYGSLLALSEEPSLWQRAGGGDERLLPGREDFEDLGRSDILNAMWKSSSSLVEAVAQEWQSALAAVPAAIPPLMPLAGEKPPAPPTRWWEDGRTTKPAKAPSKPLGAKSWLPRKRAKPAWLEMASRRSVPVYILWGLFVALIGFSVAAAVNAASTGGGTSGP